MLSELYWIDAGIAPRLAIMARPRAGDWLEDEIAHWKRSGVGIIVSLLEREEIKDLDLEREAPLCEAYGLQYASFPIPDRQVPSNTDVAVRFADDIRSKGAPIALHCRAGIGRSSIMAAAILIRGGMKAEAALQAIGQARRLPVPDTDAQRAWVMSLERV